MPKPLYYGLVLKPVDIYASASTFSQNLGKLSAGTSITVFDQSGSGSFVWVKHNKGWSIANSAKSGQTISLRIIVENTNVSLDPTAGVGNSSSNNNTGNSNNTSSSTTDTKNTTTTENIKTENTTKKEITDVIKTVDTTASNKTMRLFGSPFQFNEYTDHRVSSISDFFGKKYAERVVAHAPYITIIPGDADYLGGETGVKKQEDSAIILSRIFKNDEGGGISFEDSTNATDQTRYYNFKQNYSGYIDRVNLTLRTMATMLGIGKIALPVYEDGKVVETVQLSSYDWSNYRWDAVSYTWEGTAEGALQGGDVIGSVIKNIGDASSSVLTRVANSNVVFQAVFSHYTNSDTTGEETLDDNRLADTYTTRNYIQFYIDPTQTDATDTLSNRTEPSKLRSIFESQQSNIKEMAFIANTSGMDTNDFGDAVGEAINSALGTLSNSGLKGVLGRVAQAAGNVIKGENIILPDVYQESSRDTNSRSFKINLYSPYGTPLSIYLNILVPIGFLVCLTAPANKSANSYEAPPLVKVFYDGVYSCSLGIVEGLTITKDGDWTADGLPTSATVSLDIKDLYSDLSTNSASEDVELFMHNSSLIEFLLTQCGLSMVTYNFDLKTALRWNTSSNLFSSTASTTGGRIVENILSDVINKFNNVI